MFIIKLILSYLPVRLTYSLPTSPLSPVFEVEELTGSCGSYLGLPVGAARHTIRAASIWLPMNGVKMLYMIVGVIRAWALSDVQVSMTILVL